MAGNPRLRPLSVGHHQDFCYGGPLPNREISNGRHPVVKLRLRDNEKIQDAVKRFRKLVEHAGIKKEMRRREYYEKPSDTARRARRRAARRARMTPK